MSLRLSVLCLSVSVLVCACQKKSEAPAPPPPVAHLPPVSQDAEVEFAGEWASGGLTGASVEFVAQLEPCLPVPGKPTRLGAKTLEAEGRLFAEFYIHQGTVGHACLYAKDAAGVVVGAASYEKNPITFAGQGEVSVGPMHLVLSKLP